MDIDRLDKSGVGFVGLAAVALPFGISVGESIIQTIAVALVLIGCSILTVAEGLEDKQ